MILWGQQVLHISILAVFRSYDIVGRITAEGDSDEQAASRLYHARTFTQSGFVIGEMFKTIEAKNILHRSVAKTKRRERLMTDTPFVEVPWSYFDAKIFAPDSVGVFLLQPGIQRRELFGNINWILPPWPQNLLEQMHRGAHAAVVDSIGKQS